MVSNKGGATARPTMATRVALISRPAFTFSAAGYRAESGVAGIVIPVGESGQRVG